MNILWHEMRHFIDKTEQWQNYGPKITICLVHALGDNSSSSVHITTFITHSARDKNAPLHHYLLLDGRSNQFDQMYSNDVKHEFGSSLRRIRLGTMTRSPQSSILLVANAMHQHYKYKSTQTRRKMACFSVSARAW